LYEIDHRITKLDSQLAAAGRAEISYFHPGLLVLLCYKLDTFS
jgi:hypothetical protein